MDLTTAASLHALVLVHPYFRILELTGIVDNGTTLRLGVVEVDTRHPEFRPLSFGFWSTLRDTATFRIMAFNVPMVDRRGSAVMFREFGRPDDHQEYLAGWVPPDHHAQAEAWVKTMNRHIKKMLKQKHHHEQEKNATQHSES
jgi:hypothetical protein